MVLVQSLAQEILHVVGVAKKKKKKKKKEKKRERTRISVLLISFQGH